MNNKFTETDIVGNSPERIGPRLPLALETHVGEGRLEQQTAVNLYHELAYQSETIAQVSDVNRRSNVLFLDNGEIFERYALPPTRAGMSEEEIKRMFHDAILSMPQLNAYDATFRGEASEIGTFLHTLTAAARERFSMESHALLNGKDSLAFDLDYVDQYGDWDAPTRLDELVQFATDPALLTASFSDEATEIIRHDRDHPKIKYEFWRTAIHNSERETIMVIRKRPYADIVVGEGDSSMCLEIFRKSWFLVSAQKDNPDLSRAIARAEHSASPSKTANTVIAKYVNDILSPENESKKRQQTEVLPCTMTYVIQIRNPHPNNVEPDVELES